MINFSSIASLPSRLFGGNVSANPNARSASSKTNPRKKPKAKRGRHKPTATDATFARHLLTTADSQDPKDVTRAKAAMQQRMALVPSGSTLLSPPDFMLAEYVDDESASQGNLESVSAFYIDRYAVSNADFQQFVLAGGYQQMDLWPIAVRPFVMKMVDQTGQPGPRFWNDGNFDSQLSNHPIVGVCWFEANAFATWAGRQLLTSAQWQHAGTWSNTEAFDQGSQKYPWGNNFDAQRANTWRAGIGATVPVEEFYDGCTPNGVYQLIGNAWQWVTNRFDPNQNTDEADIRSLMGEIRGGAFDTYFESQVTCQFRTGQPLLHRGANVGFRCCLPATNVQSN